MGAILWSLGMLLTVQLAPYSPVLVLALRFLCGMLQGEGLVRGWGSGCCKLRGWGWWRVRGWGSGSSVGCCKVRGWGSGSSVGCCKVVGDGGGNGNSLGTGGADGKLLSD